MVVSLAWLLKALVIGLAGAVGAGTRHVIATRSRARWGDEVPWGTLVINLSGALLIGVFTGLLVRHQGFAAWHAPLVLGFLGGYTTFSTFMLELARLRERSAHHLFGVYVAASLLLGPILAFVGLLLGKGR